MKLKNHKLKEGGGDQANSSKSPKPMLIFQTRNS